MATPKYKIGGKKVPGWVAGAKRAKARGKKPRSPRSVAEAIAQAHALSAKVEKMRKEMAEQERLIKQLQAEAEALRAAPVGKVVEPKREPSPTPFVPPKIRPEDVRPPTMAELRARAEGMPPEFKPVAEIPEAEPVEIAKEHGDQIAKYLADLGGTLEFEGFPVHPRAVYLTADNTRAEGELVIRVPRGTHHRMLTANVGRIMGKMGPVPGAWITAGWYFDVRGAARDKYLRYRGGTAVFAYAQHADTTGEMATNLITANKLGDSFQRNNDRKPTALIFRLLWTSYTNPDRVNQTVWNRNGGQPPKI